MNSVTISRLLLCAPSAQAAPARQPAAAAAAARTGRQPVRSTSAGAPAAATARGTRATARSAPLQRRLLGPGRQRSVPLARPSRRGAGRQPPDSIPAAAIAAGDTGADEEDEED